MDILKRIFGNSMLYLYPDTGAEGGAVGGSEEGGEDTGDAGGGDDGDTGDTGGGTDGDSSFVSGGDSGDTGGEGGGPQAPAWLAQASKQYKDREDLWGHQKIDDLIAERDRLEEKTKSAPEVPEEYELGIQEGDDVEATKELASKAKELGMSQEQFNLMVQTANNQSKKFASKLAENVSGGYTSQSAADLFQREWGKNFDAEYSNMRRGIKVMGGESFNEFLNKTGAGNNPQMIRSLAKLGSLFAEDGTALSESEGGIVDDGEKMLRERYPSMFS